MKNEKIINALNMLEPSEQTETEIFNIIIQKQNKKQRVLKSTKILATAAAVMLIIGIVNIQTVIAFIGGLFFVPGAGVLSGDINIDYYGLAAPVDIETEYGVITLKFVTKITKDGETSLGMLFSSYDIPAQNMQDYPIYIDIDAGGENLLSNEEIRGSGGWGSDGRNYVNYQYIYKNFPGLNNFDLTILGVTTSVFLENQTGNFALSQENNGIIVAASKFGGVKDIFALDIYDIADSAKDYYIIIGYLPSASDINGDEIFITNGGGGGFNPDMPLSYQLIQAYKNEKEMKSIISAAVRLSYYRKEPLSIDIPVPKDGETVKTNIQIPIGSYTFKITEVRRDGDIIYYEKNSQEIVTMRGKFGGNFKSSWWENFENFDKERVIKNREYYIESVSFYNPGHADGTCGAVMGGGEIWNFDENAESLRFYFDGASIVQFGDFDIEFD